MSIFFETLRFFETCNGLCAYHAADPIHYPTAHQIECRIEVTQTSSGIFGNENLYTVELVDENLFTILQINNMDKNDVTDFISDYNAESIRRSRWWWSHTL